MTDVEQTSADAYPPLMRIGGSDMDKSGLVEALTAIMESFVDRAFGIDSAQLAQAVRTAKGQSTRPIHSRRSIPVRPARRSRSRAFPHVAIKSTKKRRTKSC